MTPDPVSKTTAVTNLPSYERNLRKIIAYTGDHVRLMAVVKANAYGHGIHECSRTALKAGASMLGVALAAEGVALRKEGITSPILVLGPESFDHIGPMINHDLTITLFSFPQLEALQKQLTERRKGCRVHIKVDTGMGRIGIQPEEAPALVEKARAVPGITMEGIFTHFPSADEDRDEYSRDQIARFKQLLDHLERNGMRPDIAHMCNSAATLKFPEAHIDMVRPGIMTFGLIPYPGSEKTLTLEPVMSLTSVITFIKEVPAGYAISYGGTHITTRPSRLATVPVGYGDGYNRHLSNRGKALVNGVPVPVAGRVCMDQTVFDVTDAGKVREGDPIVLIGESGGARITVEDHACIAGTISHEIVTGITSRVSRTFIPAS